MTDTITSIQLDETPLRQSPQTKPGDRYRQQDVDTLLRLASFSLDHPNEKPSLTAREIRTWGIPTTIYGYDKDEIDDLIDRIATTLEQLQSNGEETEAGR